MKSFKIEELEERIAPAALNLGSMLGAAANAPGVGGASDNASINAAASSNNGAINASAGVANNTSLNILGNTVSLGASVNASASGNVPLVGGLLGNLGL